MAKDGKAQAERISLWDAFAEVPDPRACLGKRHPLQAVLTLCAVRNVAVTLLDQDQHANKAAALRRHAAHPQEALTLVKAGSG